MLIALTGGIGSGKSTVASRLAERGAVVVDADRLAREVVEPGAPALAAIVREFGGALLRDGALDRAALGRIVFADPAARHRLNAIVHPAVVARSHELFATALEGDPDAIVVYDVPLIDARGVGEFDRVVVVDAPPSVRLRRLVETRGMSESDASARIAAQMPDADRLALASDVIVADGTLEDTLEQADALWQRLTASRPDPGQGCTT